MEDAIGIEVQVFATQSPEHPLKHARGVEEQVYAMYSQGHPPEHSKSKCQKHYREDEISQGKRKKVAPSGRGDIASEEETAQSEH